MATSRELDIINVADIVVPEGRRPVGAEAVASLAASLEVIGLRTPITVRIVDNMEIDGHPTDGVPVLVTGAHRLAAAKQLGWESIECWVSPNCDEIDAEMWEIAENLHRAELTALERDQQVARWVELSAQRNKPAQTAPVSGGRGNKGGVNAAASELGIERTDAQRATKVASLSDEAKEAAKECGLDDNRTALLKAAKEDSPGKQVQRLHEISDAKKRAKTADSKNLKEEAAEKVAALLSEHIPGEHWDALKANLRTAGAKNIANELDRLIGVSVFDNTRAGSAP